MSRAEEGSAAELEVAATKATVLGSKLGAWALGRLDGFITKAIDSVATELGKIVAAWIVARHLGDLAPLLDHAAKLLHH